MQVEAIRSHRRGAHVTAWVKQPQRNRRLSEACLHARIMPYPVTMHQRRLAPNGLATVVALGVKGGGVIFIQNPVIS